MLPLSNAGSIFEAGDNAHLSTFLRTEDYWPVLSQALGLQKVGCEVKPVSAPRIVASCELAGKLLLIPMQGSLTSTNSWVLLPSLGSFFSLVSVQARLWE